MKVWIYKGEILTQTLRTTPRTIDTSKPYEERQRRPRRDGDRRGGFRREGGFNRDNNRDNNRGPRRDGQGFNRGPRPEKKEGGAQ